MYIQTELTPNPNCIKFLPNVIVSKDDVYNFVNLEEAKDSPLAEELLIIDGVLQVFLGYDFISITKRDDINWDFLKPQILSAIMDHIMSGKNILNHDASKVEQEFYDEKDSEVVAEIKEILEERVRPSVASDGGDIIFRGFKNGVVYLELHGSCKGCPSSQATLKDGIENMLQHYVPEVIAVEAMS